MSGNGLQIADFVGLDLELMVEELSQVAINELTVEEVREAFIKWRDTMDPDSPVKGMKIMADIAKFIFKNGAHESIPDILEVRPGLTWKTLKDGSGFGKAKKAMFLRWAAPLLQVLAEKYPDSSENFLYRVCAKWEILDEFAAVPVKVRYFGGFYNSSATRDEHKKILNLQKRIIKFATAVEK